MSFLNIFGSKLITTKTSCSTFSENEMLPYVRLTPSRISELSAFLHSASIKKLRRGKKMKIKKNAKQL